MVLVDVQDRCPPLKSELHLLFSHVEDARHSLQNFCVPADLEVRAAAKGPSAVLRLLEVAPWEPTQNSAPLGALSQTGNLFPITTGNRGCHAADQRDVEGNSAQE